MSYYDYTEEFGVDPFSEYTNNADLKQKLVDSIPTAINYAVNRPKDPLQPNERLLNLSNELSVECGKDFSCPSSPCLMHRFWRVCGLPNPLEIEEQRLRFIEKEKEAEFQRNNPPTPQQLAEQIVERIKSHSGGWSFHDHECICGRYFDDFPCPRGGYIWSCCGSTKHDSVCSRSKSV
jgi:hypothetical protein